MHTVEVMQTRPALVVVFCLCLVFGVLSVRLSVPPAPLYLRRPVGRPRVLTARHLPAADPAISVRYHDRYDPAFLRGLGIRSASHLRRVAHLHRVLMGVGDPSCDDGRTNLTLDWEPGAPAAACPASQLLAETGAAGRVDCQRRLPDDVPLAHVCMNASLRYGPGVPTYGHHRPLWPVYGTYRYLPPQRWLHSVEHGAVVLLHHPCAPPGPLRRLRALVARCIFKHVVTPSPRVTRSRPLVLVAHGCAFQMARVSTELVVAFIRAHALHGKEGCLPKQGQFRDQLLREARVPRGSDANDSVLCPFFPRPTASDSLFTE